MIILDLIHQLFPDNVMMAVIAPWLGAGISAASAVGNAIFGGISANKQKREQLKALRKQQQENRNWYNRRYNEDATQRADVQRMLSQTNEAIASRNRAASGKQKVVGGTDATLASTQQANAEAVGDAISQVASNAETRKDNIEAQYRERKSELDAAEDAVKANAETAKRNATAQAATAALTTGAGIMANTDDDTKAKVDVTADPPNGAAVLADVGAKKGAEMLTPKTVKDYVDASRKSIWDYPELKRLKY